MEKAAGSTIAVPKRWEMAYLPKDKRNEIIRNKYLYENVPVKEIAEEYCLTESAVYEIVRKRTT